MQIQKLYQGAIPSNKVMTTTTSSDTDTYSCNYMNKYTYDVLYTGSTTGDIPLSSNSGNYSYLLIFWQNWYNGTRCGVALAPISNYFTLSSIDLDVNSYASSYTNCALYDVSGDTIKFIEAKNYAGANSNPFSVYKVIGYK